MFLTYKDEKLEVTTNEKRTQLASIRSDHDREFENQLFIAFCFENVINHDFFTPKTPHKKM